MSASITGDVDAKVAVHISIPSPSLSAGSQPPPLHLCESSHQKRKVRRMRREKYTARACVECQKRKVKCSGENVCNQCRSRNIECVYTSHDENNGEARIKRRRGDLSSEDSRIVHSPEQSSAQRILSRSRDSVFSGDDNNMQQLMQIGDRRLSMDMQESEPSTALPMTPRSSAQMLQDLSISSPQVDMVHACDGETDTFEAILLQSQSLSLSSQLTSLRKLLGLDSIPMELSTKLEPQATGFLCEFPIPSHARHLLDVYFRDFDNYLPYLDQTDTEHRVFELLGTLGYNDNCQTISLSSEHLPLAALLCNIIAMAECLDPNTATVEERPGWSMYLQGCRLIQHCSSLQSIDLDIVRYYAVGSGYLMHAECLRAATRAISMAIQLAAKAKLNNQDAWPECSEEEVLCRKKLWWTIYFMDRRIGQKNGTPYLIRDSEVGVDDFSAEAGNRLVTQAAAQTRTSKSPNPNSTLNSDSQDYLQVLVELGRLWGQIWDRFFAVTAPNLGDWQEIEIVDKRILALQVQLPQHLTWNQELVLEYVNAGEVETQVRRRLTTFTRINTLRLIIRQNPLLERRNDNDAKRFCAELASRTIEAIATFRKIYRSARPSGYFMTSSLVECICQLVPLLQVRDFPVERAAAVISFRTAYTILVGLSGTMHSAKRAINALKNVFSVGEVVSLFRSLVAETERNKTSGIDVSLGDDQQQQDRPGVSGGLQPLPLEMGDVQWSPPYEFMPTPSVDSMRPRIGGENLNESNLSQIPAAHGPNIDIFGPSALERMIGEENYGQSSGEMVLNCDPFMFEELGSQQFS